MVTKSAAVSTWIYQILFGNVEESKMGRNLLSDFLKDVETQESLSLARKLFTKYVKPSIYCTIILKFDPNGKRIWRALRKQVYINQESWKSILSASRMVYYNFRTERTKAVLNTDP